LTYNHRAQLHLHLFALPYPVPLDRPSLVRQFYPRTRYPAIAGMRTLLPRRAAPHRIHRRHVTRDGAMIDAAERA